MDHLTNEKTLEEIRKEIYENKKKLSSTKFVIIALLVVFLFYMFILSAIEVTQTIVFLMIGTFYIFCMACVIFKTIIEQKAGYYECPNCHHFYVPTTKAMAFSRHINKTRLLLCPNCNKVNWHFKRMSKDSHLLSESEQIELIEYEKRINAKGKIDLIENDIEDEN